MKFLFNRYQSADARFVFQNRGPSENLEAASETPTAAAEAVVNTIDDMIENNADKLNTVELSATITREAVETGEVKYTIQTVDGSTRTTSRVSVNPSGGPTKDPERKRYVFIDQGAVVNGKNADSYSSEDIMNMLNDNPRAFKEYHAVRAKQAEQRVAGLEAQKSQIEGSLNEANATLTAAQEEFDAINAQALNMQAAGVDGRNNNDFQKLMGQRKISEGKVDAAQAEVTLLKRQLDGLNKTIEDPLNFEDQPSVSQQRERIQEEIARAKAEKQAQMDADKILDELDIQ